MIHIRDIREEDIEAYYAYEQDADLQWHTGVETPRSKEAFINGYMKYLNNANSRLLLKAIEYKGTLVGRLELMIEENTGFLGIVIGDREHRGQNIGSLALRSFIRDVRLMCSVKEIKAEVYQDNPVSLGFFKKNGFYPTGRVTVESFRGVDRNLIELSRSFTNE